MTSIGSVASALQTTSARHRSIAFFWQVRGILAFLAAGIIMGLINLDALADLVRRWRIEDEYNYGPLALAVAAYLLWLNRETFVTVRGEGAWIGCAVVAAGTFLSMIGVFAESYFLQQYGILATLFGMIWATGGSAAAKACWPAFFLLLLTIPLPYTLQAIFTVKLQLLSSLLGVSAIRLIGIPIYLEGNIIDLGDYKLQVAEACSGLRYVLPLTCLSFIVALISPMAAWKRIFVFLFAAPLAVLINGVRIAIVAFLVDRYGRQMADGFLHYFEGWIIFAAGVAALLLLSWLLQGRSMRLALGPNARTVRTEVSDRGGAAVLASLAVICASFLFMHAAHAALPGPEARPHRSPFELFPQDLNGWAGQRKFLEKDITDVLKASDYLLADYSTGDGMNVELFIAYYETLSRGAALHSPRVCLPGSGWELASLEGRPFSWNETGNPGTFNRVVIQKGENLLLVYYWYQQRERATASEFWMKWYLLWDAVARGRKDGALVRVVTPISKDEDGMAMADRRLSQFVTSLNPEVARFVPR